MDSPPGDESDPKDDRAADGDAADDNAPSVESAETHDPGIGARDLAVDGEDVESRSGRGVDSAPGDSESAAPDRAVDADVRTDFDDPLGDLLPRADVDSRWWYWIAAIPLYGVLGALLVVLFVGAFLLGLAFDGGVLFVVLLVFLVPVVGIGGLVLTVLFPIATYVDARAIAESDAPWTPDPLIWGLAALATVVLSAFTLSVLQALYYLYKRHVAVGTP
jgi:hypothetical protein